MKDRDQTIYAVKNSKGEVFTIGDEFTTAVDIRCPGKTVYFKNGKRMVSKRKTRISGFEIHDKGWYVLYFPQYSDGRIEKDPKKAWRYCDLESAIKINK